MAKHKTNRETQVSEPSSESLTTPEGRESFAQESARNAPRNPLIAIAGASEDDEFLAMIGSLKRKNMPQMIEPGVIPVGAAVMGVIHAVLDSPAEKVKGVLLHIRHKGIDFTLPVTGSIRQALSPGMKNDSAGLRKKLEEYVGVFIFAKREPDKATKNYGANAKPTFIFDVRVGPVPKQFAADAPE